MKAGSGEQGNIYWAPYIKLGTVIDGFIHLFYVGLAGAPAETGSERLSDEPKIGQPLGDKVGTGGQADSRALYFNHVTGTTLCLWFR